MLIFTAEDWMLVFALSMNLTVWIVCRERRGSSSYAEGLRHPHEGP